MAEQISEVIKHLQYLLEDANMPSHSRNEERKLDIIIRTKLENFNNLGQSQFDKEVEGNEENKAYYKLYMNDVYSTRCKICCEQMETKNCKKLKELHDSEEFALLCIGILMKLNDLLANKSVDRNRDEPIEDQCLGVKDQKFVTAALQFIVCLAILPNLYPGVSVPLSERSGLSQLFEESKDGKDINEPILLLCLENLCFLGKSKVIGPLIYTKFLGDLIGTLIQIGFQKPLSSTKTVKTETCGDDDLKSNKQCLVCQHEREWCRNELNNLVSRVYQPLVIKELLLLQRPMRTATQKSPKWLRQICGKLLSERLLQKNGVHCVISTILEGCNLNGKAALAKFDMIGKLVSTRPTAINSLQEYYQQISPQVMEPPFFRFILDLLETKFDDKEARYLYLYAASHCISWMAIQDLSLTKELIFCKIMSSFQFASSDQSNSVDSSSTDICNEERIEKNVEQIHKVFILGLDPKEHMVKILTEYGQPLFELYCFLRDSVSHLKSLLKEILLWLIQNNTATTTLTSLTCYLFGERIPGMDINCLRIMNHGLAFSNSPCGGAMLVRIDCDVKRDNVVSTEKRIVGLLDLFLSMKDKQIVGDFFVHLLQHLTSLSHPQEQINSDSSKALLIIDADISRLKYQIPLVSMIAAMCDKLGNEVLKEPEQLLEFVKLNLQRCCSETLSNSDDYVIDENNDTMKEETVSMSLGIMSLIIANANEAQENDYKKMQEFLPILKEISKLHHSPDVKKLCDDLYVSIATYGAVNGNEGDNKKANQDDRLDLKSDEAFDRAMTDVADPLIPVRGHGLLHLAHLIEARNPKALSNIDSLLTTFMDSLHHNDTYIYLAAVQGLVALSSFKHNVIMPYLAKEFAMFGKEAGVDARQQEKVFTKGAEAKGGSKKHLPEMRLKIGEALVKATRNCGPLLPKYSQILLASFLTGVKDEDDDVRTSSLSNIGEICKLLRFSIGSVIHEIFACISSVLRSDRSAKTRQAALLVVTMLLEGLGKHAIEAIGDVLKDIYRLLKMILTNEKDDVVKLYAERALGELDLIMKNYLFPEQSLQKKIQVIQSS
eukprot:gene12320-13591_t